MKGVYHRMAIKVRCTKRLILEVNDNITTKSIVSCPSDCPLKKSNRCKNNFFQPTQIINDINAKVDLSLVEKNEQVNNILNNDSSDYNPFSESNDNDYNPFSEENNNDYNPFNEPVEPSNSAPAANQGQQNKVDKYNQTISVTDIFTNVPQFGINDICYCRDLKYFYVTKQGDGDIQDALDYIFLNWRYSDVFNADLKSYHPVFLAILKTAGYKQYANELTEIIDDSSLTVNQKFFRVFYKVVRKDMIDYFYFNEQEEYFGQISPKFRNINDFIDQLVNNIDYLSDIKPYFNEVLEYLNLTKERFVKEIPLLIYQQKRIVSYIDESYGVYKFINFGTIEQFIDRWPLITTQEDMNRKLNFLNMFKIDERSGLLLREEPLLYIDNIKEVNGTYRACEIMDRFSNLAATIYNVYTTLLKDYVDSIKPKKIKVGALTFTYNNFIVEAKSVVQNGVMIYADDSLRNTYNANTYNYDLFELFKSLVRRGVLNFYVNRCESESEWQYILDNFINVDEIDPINYFKFKGINYFVYTKYGKQTVEEYIYKILDNDFETAFSTISNDKIIETWMNVNINNNQYSSDIKNLNAILKQSGVK